MPACASVAVSPSSTAPSPSASRQMPKSAKRASAEVSLPSLLLSNACRPARSDAASGRSPVKVISDASETVPSPSRSSHRKASPLPIQLVSSARPSPSRSKRALLAAALTVSIPSPPRSRMMGEIPEAVSPF
jgi:hypothetical protein